MGKRTPLYAEHEALGARMVDFAGWDMPVNYGSQIDEHHAVRRAAGMFDVSHMSVVDFGGPGARDFLRRLLANDVAKTDGKPGKAIYTCMLNTRGGVVDDLIVYHLDDGDYRAVVNAGTTDKDLAWMRGQSEGFDVAIEPRADLGIIAVQGPKARASASAALDPDLAESARQLKPFNAAVQGDWMVGRTGYTGEDGYELVLPHDAMVETWRSLRESGVAPCGLGARDTLRLEAGLNLYGQDMDEDTHPLESGLGWTVAWKPEDRDFVGREALEAVRGRVERKMVGLLLEDRGVMRTGQTLRHPEAGGEGVITSGGYAPTLERSIALARVPADWEGTVEVAVRKRWLRARIVGYPFVRNGESAL
ncbi:glycine cleavage system aminomethyltransferase GcvT [Salinisphaera sp. PC39]|uniref:glycine cleavage system aminomethyltransferase GcvT n=1 Tax=Salinisphaera sp. PC39 TaxID=1304156 RepID=UPI003342080F